MPALVAAVSCRGSEAGVSAADAGAAPPPTLLYRSNNGGADTTCRREFADGDCGCAAAAAAAAAASISRIEAAAGERGVEGLLQLLLLSAPPCVSFPPLALLSGRQTSRRPRRLSESARVRPRPTGPLQFPGSSRAASRAGLEA